MKPLAIAASLLALLTPGLDPSVAQAAGSVAEIPDPDDPNTPGDIRDLSPKLEEIVWRVKFSSVEKMATEGAGKVIGRYDRVLAFDGVGSQLVWTWEEDGSRAYRYNFMGAGGGSPDLTRTSRGTISQQGTSHSEVRETNGVLVMDGSTDLKGKLDGFRITSIGRDSDGRVCIEFRDDSRMTGRSVLQGTGLPPTDAESENLGSQSRWVRRDGDEPWPKGHYVLAREASAQRICSNAAGNATDSGRGAANASAPWTGLNAPPKARNWTFKGEHRFPSPVSTHVWTLELSISATSRTLPYPPE